MIVFLFFFDIRLFSYTSVAIYKTNDEWLCFSIKFIICFCHKRSLRNDIHAQKIKINKSSIQYISCHSTKKLFIVKEKLRH
jgi:hypothetical protein